MNSYVETTELRWFDAYPKCRQCGGVSRGILRGSRNESWGDHCKRCAEKRLRNSRKAREEEDAKAKAIADAELSKRSGRAAA